MFLSFLHESYTVLAKFILRYFIFLMLSQWESFSLSLKLVWVVCFFEYMKVTDFQYYIYNPLPPVHNLLCGNFAVDSLALPGIQSYYLQIMIILCPTFQWFFLRSNCISQCIQNSIK